MLISPSAGPEETVTRGRTEDTIHRQEGQRHLKGKLVIRKGMEQTKHRLKKPALLV